MKLLLNVPNIDVNITDDEGQSLLHLVVIANNIEGLKLLLNHPDFTAPTLNHRNSMGDTPVMLAVLYDRLEHLAVLANDLRVDLDTTDNEGRSLEEVARSPFLVAFFLCHNMMMCHISI